MIDRPSMTVRNADGLDLEALGVPHASPFVSSVCAGDTSLSQTVAHVNNIVYVAWLDRVAELHADAAGFSRERLLEEGIMWFVGRHEIDYVAEVHAGETITLVTWVRDVRRVKSWRDTVAVRERDGRIVCRASTLWVLVDLESRRPIRFTDEMVQSFAPCNTAPGWGSPGRTG